MSQLDVPHLAYNNDTTAKDFEKSESHNSAGLFSFANSA